MRHLLVLLAALLFPLAALAQCDLSATLTRLACDDAGTPADPTDDRYVAYVSAVSADATQLEVLRDDSLLAVIPTSTETPVDLGPVADAQPTRLRLRNPADTTCALTLRVDRLAREVQAPAQALTLRPTGAERSGAYDVVDAGGAVAASFTVRDFFPDAGAGDGLLAGGLRAAPAPTGGLVLTGEARISADDPRRRALYGRVSPDGAAVQLAEYAPGQAGNGFDVGSVLPVDLDRAGNAYLAVAGFKNYQVIKVSPANEVLWSTLTLGDQESPYVRLSQLTPDETGFYLAFGEFGPAPSVLRYDAATGALASETNLFAVTGKTVDADVIDFRSAAVTADGGVALGYGFGDLSYLARLEPDGSLRYDQVVGAESELTVLAELSDGALLTRFGESPSLVNPDGSRGCGGGFVPGPCTPRVSFGSDLTCDDAGTPDDPADDRFGATVLVTNGDATGAYTLRLGRETYAGRYGEELTWPIGPIAEAIGFPQVEFELVDGGDPSCRLRGFSQEGGRFSADPALRRSVEVYNAFVEEEVALRIVRFENGNELDETEVNLTDTLREQAGAGATDFRVRVGDSFAPRPDGSSRQFGTYRDAGGELRLFTVEVSAAGEIARARAYPTQALGLGAGGEVSVRRARVPASDADDIIIFDAAARLAAFVRFGADGELAWVSAPEPFDSDEAPLYRGVTPATLTYAGPVEGGDIVLFVVDRATGTVARRTFRELLGEPDVAYSTRFSATVLPDGGFVLGYTPLEGGEPGPRRLAWTGPGGERLYTDVQEAGSLERVTYRGVFADGGLLLRAFEDGTGQFTEPGFKLNADGSRGCAPPPAPDLAIAELAIVTTPVTAGELLTYTFDLANVGDADVPGDFTVGSYLSADSTLSDEDLRDGTITTGNFAAGASSEGVAGASMTTALAPGDYYLIVRVDDGDAVAERDEANNVAVAAFTVLAADPDPDTTRTADLSLAAALTSGTPAEAGAEVTVTLTLANAGPDAARAAVVSVPLPASASIVAADATGAGRLSGDAWEVGDVPAATQANLAITYRTQSEGGFLFYAEVDTAAVDDPDSTPGNGVLGVAAEDDEVVLDLRTETSGVADVLAATWAGEGLSLTFDAHALSGPAHAILTDVNGRVVARWSLELQGGEQRVSLPASQPPVGVYVIAVPRLAIAKPLVVTR